MKALINKVTREVVHISEEMFLVDNGVFVGNNTVFAQPELFSIVSISNPPIDFAGRKYLFFDGEWSLNPDYKEPDYTPEKHIKELGSQISQLNQELTKAIEDKEKMQIQINAMATTIDFILGVK